MSGGVLIAEDDLDLREEMADLLTTEGYSVLQAANGAEALEALDRGIQPCVILLDLMMPVMDGFEFLEAFSQRKSSSPVVILSGVANVEDLPVLFDVARVLRKPITLDKFLAVVSEYC